MGKTAIILGATGLTGGILLQKLIADKSYTKIKLFSRNKVTVTSSKIEEFIVDLFDINTISKDFTADVIFCCIGTTAAKTKDKNLYKAIDYGIPVDAAKLAKQNQITTFIVMSSMGADANSAIFYNRTKGEMERDVLAQNLEKTYVLRPSLIGGERNEKRVGESIGKTVMSFLNPLLVGTLAKYKMIHPNTIALCMQRIADYNHSECIIESDEIIHIANAKKS